MRYNCAKPHTSNMCTHDNECLGNGWDPGMLSGLCGGQFPARIRHQHRGKWKGTWDLITHFFVTSHESTIILKEKVLKDTFPSRLASDHWVNSGATGLHCLPLSPQSSFIQEMPFLFELAPQLCPVTLPRGKEKRIMPDLGAQGK